MDFFTILHWFVAEIESILCGRHGFLVRVMPRHPELGEIHEPGFLMWGCQSYR